VAESKKDDSAFVIELKKTRDQLDKIQALLEELLDDLNTPPEGDE
jgi:hypothetical protein